MSDDEEEEEILIFEFLHIEIDWKDKTKDHTKYEFIKENLLLTNFFSPKSAVKC
jgi:hypothetical protein